MRFVSLDLLGRSLSPSDHELMWVFVNFAVPNVAQGELVWLRHLMKWLTR